jgi:hypothetical protein
MKSIFYSANKVWTDAEIDEVRLLAKENLPAHIVASKLGRSETAIRTLAYRRKISLQPSKIPGKLRRTVCDPAAQ